MIWWIEFSIGGASFTVGNGLRYREMIVIPLENCSGGRVNTDWSEQSGRGERLTDVFPRGIKRVEVIKVGQGTGSRLV